MGTWLRLRFRRSRLIAILCWALPAAAAHGAAAAEPALRVVYPRPESGQDVRRAYPLAVLTLALEHSGRPFTLQPSAARMQQSRALLVLADGEALDVAWSVTSVERERILRPIRIPIDRGLLGWRVLLVPRGTSASFAGVDSLQALSRRLGVQGHDWPDLPVLRANGLRVAASPTYEGLFAMLSRGHIDYFPRSVTEVGAELSLHRGEAIELEPALLLRYPSALYFFVRNDDEALARAIERGLEASLRDGSLDALFEGTFGPLLASLDLAHRRTLWLERSDLPPRTPLARRELWYQPRPVP